MKAIQINVHFNEPVFLYEGLQDEIYHESSDEEE